MTTFVAIQGVSGSGKDTVASLIDNSANIKFSRYTKDRLEREYNLKPGTLDTPRGKNLLVPGKDLTFLELLINLYHSKDDELLQLQDKYVLRLVHEAWLSRATPCFTDVRTAAEVDTIVRLKQEYNAILTTVRLHRTAATAHSSDSLCDSITNELLCHSRNYHIIYNNGSLAELEQLVRHAEHLF